MGWIIALCALLVLLIVILVFSFFAYRLVFYVPSKHKEDVYAIPDDEQYAHDRDKMISLIKEIDTLPYERVYCIAKDGIALSGRYYHTNDNAPIQIQFPGYKGSSIRDFCGGCKLARELGFNVLLVDQRAHGMSEGHTITFGVKERYDCLCWIDYAINRFGKDIQIYLAGVSMGGATILMASEFDLPKNIRGIVADCPFTTPPAIIKKVCKDRGYNPKIIYPFIYLGALLFGHFKLNAANSSEAVTHTDIPVLLIHGEDDKFVPCEMSKEIKNNCVSYSELHTFPGAGHGISFIVNHERYKNIASSFLEYCKNNKIENN
ncbi:MAG: alpha/beta hydrolase [Erysipelotrichales bacterium]|nr:alpha/beta hydrolase [Erysipelotrichales bacterium]